ncbi:MAG: DNA modification methylase, partial [Erysipelotrichia bacterium]|nr:DNA modification methylase [Erysipelotrichia bacterium]
MEVENIPINQIIPYENNPRKNDKAVDVVAKSINEFGFLVPVILDNKNVIVAGHTRIKAALKLGLTEVPCIYAENLTEEQIKAFRIMENKSQEYATWDLKLLVEELKDLKVAEIDLEFTGIPESELNRLLKEGAEQKKGNKEPKYQIKKGDIYKLGEHKILCGDSTKQESYDFITDPVDLIFTDPPYGVSYTGQIAYSIENPKKGKGKSWEMIEGDDLRGEELYNFLREAFTNMNQKLTKRGAVYCFYASRNHIIFERALNDAGITVKQILIWNKHHVLGRSDYHWCHEPIMYGHKTGENCQFYGDRIEKTILNKPLSNEEINNLEDKDLRKILKNIIKNSDVWTEKKDSATSYIHPTQKPITLAKRAIINSTPRNGVVLDPFAGSGSTLMA